MKKESAFLILTLIVLALTLNSMAQMAGQSSVHIINISIFTGGSGNSTSSVVFGNFILGQPFVGVSDDNISRYGFFHTTDKTMNVSGVLAADINLSFGPNVSYFRFGICGPMIINETAQPENQTNTIGIDYICNNGTITGNVDVNLNSIPATGWDISVSNTSLGENFINLTVNATTWKPLYYGLTAGQCFYAFYNASCSNVTTNPNTYEQYRIT